MSLHRHSCSDRFDREWALGAVQDLIVKGNAMPVCTGLRQHLTSVGDVGFWDVLQCPRSNERALALDEGERRREYDVGRRQMVASNLSGVFAQ